MPQQLANFSGKLTNGDLTPILSEPGPGSGVYELRPVVGQGIIGGEAA